MGDNSISAPLNQYFEENAEEILLNQYSSQNEPHVCVIPNQESLSEFSEEFSRTLASQSGHVSTISTELVTPQTQFNESNDRINNPDSGERTRKKIKVLQDYEGVIEIEYPFEKMGKQEEIESKGRNTSIRFGSEFRNNEFEEKSKQGNIVEMIYMKNFVLVSWKSICNRMYKIKKRMHIYLKNKKYSAILKRYDDRILKASSENREIFHENAKTKTFQDLHEENPPISMIFILDKKFAEWRGRYETSFSSVEKINYFNKF